MATPEELRKAAAKLGLSKDVIRLSLAANGDEVTSVERVRSAVVPQSDIIERRQPVGPRAKPKLNKTETRWLGILTARAAKEGWTSLRSQAITIELGEHCRYTPDFSAMIAGRLTFWEVKGAHVWDDAKVKFKVAPRLYPEFSFWLAQWKGGQWLEYQLQP